MLYSLESIYNISIGSISYACMIITLVMIIIMMIKRYIELVAKPVIISGNSVMKDIINRCPSMHQMFWPTPYCYNEHLQFVPFILSGFYLYCFPPYRWYREGITLCDNEIIHLDWVISLPSMLHGITTDATDTTPILMIHHGAFCCSNDLPSQSYIQPALDRGWMVCVFNRRGHVSRLTTSKFNFFGCIQDVRVATQKILDKRPLTKIFTVGISSGSAIVATSFGEDDSNNHFFAGVGICPGYDISRCMKRFTTPYKEFLLRKGKEFFLEENKSLLSHLAGYKDCLHANDLQQWLDATYSMAGCESVDDYYKRYNPMNNVHRISKPCLFINSENDPLCTIENVNEQKDYLATLTSNYTIVVTKSGSHCPFYEGMFMKNWAEKVTFEFFDSVLFKYESSNHRKES